MQNKSIDQNNTTLNVSHKRKTVEGINEKLYNDATKRKERKKLIEETVFKCVICVECEEY